MGKRPQINQSSTRRITRRAFVLAAASVAASRAGAANRYWVATNGVFNSTINWSTASGGASGASVPGNGDYAYISFNDAVNRTITYQNPSPTGPLQYLTVDQTGTGSLTFNQAQDVLSASQVYVGDSGTATANFSGGIVNLSSGASTGLFVGYDAGHSFMTISGTTTINISNPTSASLDVGVFGSGTVTQSGGSVNFTVANGTGAEIDIAYYQNTFGSYNLQNGTINITSPTGTEVVGDGGIGALVQSGGVNNVSILTLGNSPAGPGYAAGTGIYTLSAGTLNSGQQIVGAGGVGAFTQSGGTNNIATMLTVGQLANSGIGANAIGTYNLQGGLLASTGTEQIGLAGSGTFNQSGGTHTVSGDMFIGKAATGSTGAGTYTLSNGKLTVGGTEYVGLGESGTFSQSGGVNTSAYVQVGLNSTGPVGAYNLSGGSLTTTFNQYIGNNGVGTFTQSGGSNTVVNGGYTGIYLGFNGGTGTYNLQNGALSVNATQAEEYVGYGATGTFNQSGGSNTAYYLTTGYFGGSGGTYNLSNGALNVGFEYEGWFGNGLFNQTGGTHTITFDLDLGYHTNGSAPAASGTFVLQGGSLTTGGSEHVGFFGNGGFNQSAGVNTTTGLLVGDANGATGSYILSGGTLNVTGSEAVGASGQGTFTQTGGVHSVTGPLTVALNPGATGAYYLQGGSLAAPVVNNGYFFQTAGAFTGTFTNAATYNFSGPATFSGNLVQTSAGTLSLSSAFTPTSVTNSGTIDVAGSIAATSIDNEGGAINLNGSAITVSGALLNNGAITGFGTIGGTGTVTNNGLLQQGAGNLALNASAQLNLGTINLTAARQLVLGGPLANGGSLNVNGGFVSGTATLSNTVAGVITGPGTLAAPLGVNAGAIVVPAGTLNVTQPFTNAGSIQLTAVGANFAGAAVTNTGTVQGFGNVASALDNAGTVEAIGGTLALNGTLRNEPLGLLRAASGNKLLVTQGLASNLGTISLTGGTFDNNNKPLINTGIITGFGTLSTGGMTNAAGGLVVFSNGQATINGALNNATGGTVRVTYSPALFTGPVTNNGTFKITGTTATFAAPFTNNGLYTSDPATTHFSTLTFGPAGALAGGVGDKFYVSGDFGITVPPSSVWLTLRLD